MQADQMVISFRPGGGNRGAFESRVLGLPLPILISPCFVHMAVLPPLHPSSVVAWCGKLNGIACASETCARIPSSNANPPFWNLIHIVIPERPTECTMFDVIAEQQPYNDAPDDIYTIDAAKGETR